ncbi:MAG: hypothetical protein ACYDH4_02585 [Candidatus Cryosericum sp.]
MSLLEIQALFTETGLHVKDDHAYTLTTSRAFPCWPLLTFLYTKYVGHAINVFDVERTLSTVGT